MLKVLERQHRDAQVVHKCMERLLLASSIYKIPVHLQITRTSALSPPRLQGSCSPTNYKNVGIFATTTSRASQQAIKFIFTIEKIGAFATKKAFAFPVFQLQVLPGFIFPRTFFSSLSFDYFAWGRLIVVQGFCFPIPR